MRIGVMIIKLRCLWLRTTMGIMIKRFLEKKIDNKKKKSNIWSKQWPERELANSQTKTAIKLLSAQAPPFVLFYSDLLRLTLPLSFFLLPSVLLPPALPPLFLLPSPSFLGPALPLFFFLLLLILLPLIVFLLLAFLQSFILALLPPFVLSSFLLTIAILLPSLPLKIELDIFCYHG